MRNHRKTEGFNLAFLDIMACGLGAVVLVFMLVKHNVERPITETESLTSDVEYLKLRQEELQQNLVQLERESKTNINTVTILETALNKLSISLVKEEMNVAQKKDRIEVLKEDIASRSTAQIAHKEDMVDDERGGEENYLIGLKVEGRRIAVLVDSSASMTDDTLLEIIKRKNGSSDHKKRGPKWLRTRKIVRWILARTPNTSKLLVVYFNESVQPTDRGRWVSLGDTAALEGLYKELDRIVPEGGTNLQKGLKVVSRSGATDLYLITDGLPTLGDSSYSSLNPFSNCSSLLGNATTISGECRVKLFRQSIKESSLQGVKINVILLPIEGDPEAANEYWSWTALTGGLLISPAMNWP